MSMPIDERPAKFCLRDCPYMSLDVKSDTLYADSEVSQIINTVSCEHEDVCKMWAKREEVHGGCLGCQYDESSCTNPQPCIVNEFGNRTGYISKKG